jgi:hypothetical protein
VTLNQEDRKEENDSTESGKTIVNILLILSEKFVASRFQIDR